MTLEHVIIILNTIVIIIFINIIITSALMSDQLSFLLLPYPLLTFAHPSPKTIVLMKNIGLRTQKIMLEIKNIGSKDPHIQFRYYKSGF